MEVLIAIIAFGLGGFICAIGMYKKYQPQVNAHQAEIFVKSEEIARLGATLAAKEAAEKLHGDMSTGMLQQFSSLANEVLNSVSERMGREQTERLEGAGKMIVGQVDEKNSAINRQMNTLADTIISVQSVMGEVRQGLQGNIDYIGKLDKQTTNLNLLLSSSQARGSWGEKTVEDMLRGLGIIEGVSFTTQTQIAGGTARPDFTFMLPKGKIVHLDCKFPFAKYRDYLETEDKGLKEQYTKEFIFAVKNHIKELPKRGYIDISNGTLDFALEFIPNEAVLAFVYEKCPDIIDFAQENKVMLCSPLSLYSFLSILNQSVASFAMAENVYKVMEAVEKLAQQWDKYSAAGDDLGKTLDKASKQFDTMITTRSKALERSVKTVLDLGKTAEVVENTDGPVQIESGING